MKHYENIKNLFHLIRKFAFRRAILQPTKLGGPAQVFPPIFFFDAGDLFFRSAKKPQKTDRRRTKRGPFFNTMRFPPPHCRNFTIDLQQRWSINHKIGDRQCTYYLIVRALTVADCCFFCSYRRSGAITEKKTHFRRVPIVSPFRLPFPPFNPNNIPPRPRAPHPNNLQTRVMHVSPGEGWGGGQRRCEGAEERDTMATTMTTTTLPLPQTERTTSACAVEP